MYVFYPRNANKISGLFIELIVGSGCGQACLPAYPTEQGVPMAQSTFHLWASLLKPQSSPHKHIISGKADVADRTYEYCITHDSSDVILPLAYTLS